MVDGQTVRNGLGLRDLRLVHETFSNQLCGGIVPNTREPQDYLLIDR
jgi:hypothetical protein